MSCRHSPTLSLYHDGQLPAAQAEEVRRHLGSCLVCRREMAALEGLGQALQLPEFEPGPVRRFGRRPAPRRRLWPVAAAGLAAAILLTWNPGPSPATRTYAIKTDEASYTISTRGEVELLSIGIEDVEASFSLE